VANVLHDLVDVHGLLVRRLARSEQRIDERREPIGFRDDHGRVLVQRWFLELALEQLRRPAQAAERILDLVRELPNHRTAAAELGQQVVLTRDALVVRRVGELDHDAARPARWIERRDRHVEHAGGPPGPASNGISRREYCACAARARATTPSSSVFDRSRSRSERPCSWLRLTPNRSSAARSGARPRRPDRARSTRSRCRRAARSVLRASASERSATPQPPHALPRSDA
jgi:hypothetical protein